MPVDRNDAATLEQRVRLIEDRLKIYNLIASHPPSADTGAGVYTASVWIEHGVFDRRGGAAQREAPPEVRG